jgi:hypothetical protein
LRRNKQKSARPEVFRSALHGGEVYSQACHTHCHNPNLDAPEGLTVAKPDENDWTALVETAPPMKGLEYLNSIALDDCGMNWTLTFMLAFPALPAGRRLISKAAIRSGTPWDA